MKRILFYTDTPLLGGAENQMYLLAKFLPKDKYAVTLACASRASLNPWCQKFMELGIPVIRLKVFHKHDPRHFLYLKKLLPEFDIMHMHVWNPASCRYGFLATKKTPLVITEHDPFPLNGVKGWFKKKLMKRVQRIIVASEAAKQLVLEQEESWDPLITVIPNGIDIETWREQAHIPNRNEFRRIHFNALPNGKVILCVAELSPRKGQKYLIEAVRMLSPEFPNVKLVFIGEGPSRKHYENLAHPLEDRVLFLGHRKEIAKFMAASDIFVLPSVREAFGLVLLEASISGVPVIATNVGGIPEIIEDSKTGLLVAPEDSKKLASAIRLLLTDRDLGQKLARGASQRIETRFRAKTMAERTGELYDSVLAMTSI